MGSNDSAPCEGWDESVTFICGLPHVYKALKCWIFWLHCCAMEGNYVTQLNQQRARIEGADLRMDHLHEGCFESSPLLWSTGNIPTIILYSVRLT